MKLRLLGAALIGIAALAAVTPANAATKSVAISANGYHPASLTIAPGDSVNWTNADPNNHTVTADDGSFDTTLSPGATFAHAFTTLGTFGYHCTIHSFMHGTIIVANPTTTTTAAPTTIPPTTAKPTTTTTVKPTTTTTQTTIDLSSVFDTSTSSSSSTSSTTDTTEPDQKKGEDGGNLLVTLVLLLLIGGAGYGIYYAVQRMRAP